MRSQPANRPPVLLLTGLRRELFGTGELRQLAQESATIAAVIERLAPRIKHVLAMLAPAPETHTGPCVLLVTGAPASGKSTLRGLEA